MKKIVFILFVLTLTLLIKNDEKYIIPSDAIRFRIIANSNNIEDQLLKSQVKMEVEEQLEPLLKDVSSNEQAQDIITNNLSIIEETIKHSTLDYSISLGNNYFPEKEYKNVIYPAGDYESLVITLGSGLGKNWWCVLYPPLCFVDETKVDGATYDFYIKKIFQKLNS